MSFTVWFTGLPCSGKTTLSRRLYNYLKHWDYQVHLMDGDAIRAQLPRPLSFSKEDRDSHGRRLGSLAQSINDRGIICIVAAITPYAETREHNRRTLAKYIEVFCSCPVAVAESRDSRGLYAKARSGKISNFTGVSDPYEEPEAPEVVVFTEQEDIDTSLAKILDYLEKHGLIQETPKPRQHPETQPGEISPVN
uniref:Adenylyl-sulfate kinase n=1 Tax=Desulfobacca acetoxidans TaxID=60893 RepID=A0A7C3V6U0_9BACT